MSVLTKEHSMNQFRNILFIFVFNFSILAFSEPKNINDYILWKGAISNTINFFNRFAWDSNSGTYASEINRDGSHINENRDIVALSRMIYANSRAPVEFRDLDKAKRIANFIVSHMMDSDELGLYFRSTVNQNGVSVNIDRNYTFNFEQAYGISGLVALYSVDPENNQLLLPIIQKASNSFWRRFYDPIHGGLYYYYNFKNKNHTNDQGMTHKSYQSNIYPISSFLFDLMDIDAKNSDLYKGWIQHLLNVATTHIIEIKDSNPTGWLVERFNEDWTVDQTYKMTEAGHITQLSWVMNFAEKRGFNFTNNRNKTLSFLSHALLENFIKHNGLSPIGVVYDAFDRTTGNPLVYNGQISSAWWSNLEAIIAFSALKKDLRNSKVDGVLNLTTVDNILKNLTNGYFNYFVDKNIGGDFFRINASNGEVIDGTKGAAGKSGYHVTETFRFL